MSIDAICLRNFRGFREVVLPLRPLTVLVGPNSAGKSCFGHALMALRQAHLAGGGDPDLSRRGLDNWERYPIDVGDYQEVRHQESNGQVVVGLLMPRGWVELGFGGFSRQDAGTLALATVAVPAAHEMLQTAGVTTHEAARPSAAVEQRGGVVAQHGVVANEAPFARYERRGPQPDALWRSAQTDTDFGLFFAGLRLVAGATHGSGRSATSQPAAHELNEVFLALDDLSSVLNGLRYLGPTRMQPRRRGYDVATGKLEEGIGASGRYTAQFLLERHTSALDVPFRRPPPLPRSREDAASQLAVPPEWREHSLSTWADAVDFWVRYLGLATRVEAHHTDGELRLDARVHGSEASRPLTDLGFGVSQALPIIVQGLSTPITGTLIVEQPEAQLHPRPQAELADFFLSLALSNRQVLIETHSEALFDRLRLRAEIDPFIKDLVAVYFLEQPERADRCELPQAVALGGGERTPWPRGFVSDAIEAELVLQRIRAANLRG